MNKSLDKKSPEINKLLDVFYKNLDGHSGELWLGGFKRFVRNQEVWPKGRPWKVWKTVTLGPSYPLILELLEKRVYYETDAFGECTTKDTSKVIEGGSYQDYGKFDPKYAHLSYYHARIKIIRREEKLTLKLVKVKVRELGFKEEERPTLRQICRRAKKKGLVIPPPEAVLRLYQQYPNPIPHNNRDWDYSTMVVTKESIALHDGGWGVIYDRPLIYCYGNQIGVSHVHVYDRYRPNISFIFCLSDPQLPEVEIP